MTDSQFHTVVMGTMVGVIFGTGLVICWHLVNIATVLETLSK